MKIRKFLFSLFSVLLASLLLISCDGMDKDDPDPMVETPAEFRVTFTNTTANQPLSPVAVVLHNVDYSAWSIGSPVSAGLEVLAESGSPDMFLAEAVAELDSAAGEGLIAPGASASLDLSAIVEDGVYLSIATMLVNTNDAFTGANALDLSDMELGDSMSVLAAVYDAGTESNTETAESIPGPAAGGEGSSTERETRDQVTRHPGVVTQADGYMESVLDESHRFDNGAMLITIERTM